MNPINLFDMSKLNAENNPMKITYKQKIQEIICPKTYKVKPGIRIPLKFSSAHYSHSDGVNDQYFTNYINSALLPAAFNRRLAEKGLRHGLGIALDNLPDSVTVDTSGFLAVITIDL